MENALNGVSIEFYMFKISSNLGGRLERDGGKWLKQVSTRVDIFTAQRQPLRPYQNLHVDESLMSDSTAAGLLLINFDGVAFLHLK